jgi:hypothetical protein
MSVRTLKVQPLFTKSRFPLFPSPVYSMLTIRGKWLKEAGFDPNIKVRVSVDQNRIVLEPERSCDEES